MHVVLINLPWELDGRKGVRAGSRWPFTCPCDKGDRILYVPFPFFLAYSASILLGQKKKVTLFDAIAEGVSEEEAIDKIIYESPDLLVIETSTPSFKSDIRIIRNICSKVSNCRIALSGPHPSVFAEQIMSDYDFIDFILVGEYEFILLDLVNTLEGKKDLESIRGLAYRDKGRIVINPTRQSIESLDVLPWPERESLPIYNYRDNFCDLPQPNVQMLASRGCPFSCTFCVWPQTIYREHKFRKRDPADIVSEMMYLIERFKFKSVYFDDDLFNADRSHVLDICSEMEKKGLNIPWAAMARADLMDQDMLEAMSRSGLYAVKYGIESASPRILDSIKKNMDIDKVKQAIKVTKSLGIKVHLTFCLGLPGETSETIEETARFIEDVQPDSTQFSFAVPFPGTEYFKYAEKNGDLLSKDWHDYDGNNKSVTRTQVLISGDLEAIKGNF